MEQVLIGMFAGSNGYDLLFSVSLGLMGLYAVYGELKLRGFINKEVSMKNISEMWPKFFLWIDEYVGCGDGPAKAQYSREDMRYAYQAGYELSKWISIEDKIPEEGMYIFNTKRYGVIISFLSGYCAKYKKPEVSFNGKGCQVTHWMPLPEPPK